MPQSEVAKYTVTGVAVMVAWGESFQVFGSLNSSPWTARNFGADEAKARSMRQYVAKAAVNNFLMGGVGSLLLRAAGETGWWIPFAITNLITVYMTWEYESALRKGQRAGSGGWENQPDKPASSGTNGNATGAAQYGSQTGGGFFAT